MATYSSNHGAAALLPEQVADLLVTPVRREALAFDERVATTLKTNSRSVQIPVLGEDVTAQWVAEGAEIAPDDPEFSELEIIPRKVAGLTIISRELADDSSPEAAGLVGQSLAADIARRIDAALFAQPVLASPAPSGLGGITPSLVPVTGAFTDLDPFAAAVASAETLGTQITSWVTNPTDALALATLKAVEDGREPLLKADATQSAQRVIEGLPLLVSPAVKSGVVWGLPASRVVTVLREDTRVDISGEPFFSSDRVAIRAVMRVGLGFPHPASIVRIDRS